MAHALLFGSIGVLAETSEVQRRAFNAAFHEAGLDWNWDDSTYRALLLKPGGRQRIADYAASRGDSVDAAALHMSKVAHFERLVAQEGITPRPGVTELIEAAKARGMAIGFATSTTKETISLMFSGLLPHVERSSFDFIGDNSQVAHSKPAPDIYHLALRELGVSAAQAIAIEDTPECAQAAVDAGIPTFAVPNAVATGRAFPSAVTVLPALTPQLLDTQAATAAE